MVRDAQEHAEEDRQRREEVETRNQAEALTFQAERTLKDLGDKVSAEDRAETENKVASLREALKGSDVEAIKSGMQSLAETLQRVSTAAYQAASADSSGNGTDGADDAGEEPAPEGEGSPEGEAAGEEPVEGEFKEV
jgi:molecular chaperone DnaK